MFSTSTSSSTSISVPSSSSSSSSHSSCFKTIEGIYDFGKGILKVIDEIIDQTTFDLSQYSPIIKSVQQLTEHDDIRCLSSILSSGSTFENLWKLSNIAKDNRGVTPFLANVLMVVLSVPLNISYFLQTFDNSKLSDIFTVCLDYTEHNKDSDQVLFWILHASVDLGIVLITDHKASQQVSAINFLSMHSLRILSQLTKSSLLPKSHYEHEIFPDILSLCCRLGELVIWSGTSSCFPDFRKKLFETQQGLEIIVHFYTRILEVCLSFWKFDGKVFCPMPSVLSVFQWFGGLDEHVKPPHSIPLMRQHASSCYTPASFFTKMSTFCLFFDQELKSHLDTFSSSSKKHQAELSDLATLACITAIRSSVVDAYSEYIHQKDFGTARMGDILVQRICMKANTAKYIQTGNNLTKYQKDAIAFMKWHEVAKKHMKLSSKLPSFTETHSEQQLIFLSIFFSSVKLCYNPTCDGSREPEVVDISKTFSRMKIFKEQKEESKCLRLVVNIPTTAYLICTNCKLVRYCSRACQREAWLQHKTFCKMTKQTREEKIL